MHAHPFDPLSVDEFSTAREVILKEHPKDVVDFREIYLREPEKALMKQFLELEHTGKLTAETPRPPRLAKVQYDVIRPGKRFEYHEAAVDLQKESITWHEIVDTACHANLTVWEFRTLVQACERSDMFHEAIGKFELPENFKVIIEPWPYGGPDKEEENRRYFQGLCFAQDTSSGNEDSNFYAFPLPLIPIMDARTQEIIRIDILATGGKGDGLQDQTYLKRVIDHCKIAEYDPLLIKDRIRKDLKPLNVVQPEGVSFKITDGHLIEWQKWRFRLGFNPREGATIHDVTYDGRQILYRLAMSEMTVPYADPRPPFPRKQAFDFGDGGLLECTNNLTLGCDCLGQIAYFSTNKLTRDGKCEESPNVVCLHEQDDGLLWKHVNWRTGKSVAVRNRLLIIQFAITLANYDYIFAVKFDLAGKISYEARATGIVSVVNIDPGKTSEYGNVVNPGILAQNHQHIFCLRIDPAIDGHNNSILIEESHPADIDPKINPSGNLYKVVQTPFPKSGAFKAAPHLNRVVKIINPSHHNPISGKPVAYKFTPPPTQHHQANPDTTPPHPARIAQNPRWVTQLLLAYPDSTQANRALFAQNHVWITKYKDQELYAAGRFTLQSQRELDGVADAAARNESVEDEDIVVWATFGLTHNPRVEDFPVM